jgi:hypothetical protein
VLLVPGAVRDAGRPGRVGQGGFRAEALDGALDRFPSLFDPGWVWLTGRNYHGAPRIARMTRRTHVLIRLKSGIPLRRTSEILPDCSYEAELSGDGVTVQVRVTGYWVTVAGRDVPEMFCLVTDLMDYEDYPGAGAGGALPAAVGRVGLRHEALSLRMEVRDRPSPRRRSGGVKLEAA